MIYSYSVIDGRGIVATFSELKDAQQLQIDTKLTTNICKNAIYISYQEYKTGERWSKLEPKLRDLIEKLTPVEQEQLRDYYK